MLYPTTTYINTNILKIPVFFDIVIAPIKVTCENVCIIPEANIAIMNFST